MMTDPSGESHSRRPNDPENIVGRAIAGRYLVRRCISQGGMGVIYVARQEALDREVILKVVRSDRADEEAEARFRREARSLSLLSHGNIVQIFDHGFDEDTGLWFIVMEYVRGITLSKYRKRRGGVLALEEFLPIVRQMLEGVAEAHRNGLIHRDLKPSNVMLTSPDGIRLGVKILDFGLSKLARGDEEQVTRANYFAGSVMYLAPELIKNKGVDSRADVYSLGVIFYQLLSGQNPLQGDDPYEVLLQQVTTGTLPLASALAPGHGVPESLIELVDECVSLTAADRPPDARAVLERLAASLGHIVSNTAEAARAAATAQEASDTSFAVGWTSETNTASRVRIAGPPQPRSRVGLWVALAASGAMLMMMFATLGVLIALLVNNIVQQGDVALAPAPAASSDTVASEVLRQRALRAIRDGDYDRAMALTAEALEVAPQKGDLEDLLSIVTDLRDRQAAPIEEPVEAETQDEEEPNPSVRTPRPRVSPRPAARSEEVEKPVGIAVITSTPSGVPFEIVGVARGETPYRALDVPAGLHEVLFYADGQVVQTSRMTVPKGGVELLDVSLEPPRRESPPPPLVVAVPDPAPVAPDGAVAAQGPPTVYVYVPSSNKPRVLQDALHAEVPGMAITAFGSYRALKEAMEAAPPHALIAPRNVIDALGLPTHLQGRDAEGSSTERYLLVGTRSLSAAELEQAVVGIVDLAGRETSSEFVAKALQTAKAPQVKRVSEETDLLPLLQVGAADAILLPEAAARTLMSSSQMDLTEMEVAAGAGLPAISVLDDQRRGVVEAAVRGFGSDVNAKVGVASWGR